MMSSRDLLELSKRALDPCWGEYTFSEGMLSISYDGAQQFQLAPGLELPVLSKMV